MSNELDFEIVDGRQSPTAAAVQRGVCRMLIHMGFSPLTEFSLRTGRRIDVAAINAGGEIIAVEIKSSLADFRSDQKWEEYLDYCDRFFFAVPIDFPREVLPEETGMIVADQFGAEILRESPVDKLSGARRKAVTLLFARVAARRAHLVIDGGL